MPAPARFARESPSLSVKTPADRAAGSSRTRSPIRLSLMTMISLHRLKSSESKLTLASRSQSNSGDFVTLPNGTTIQVRGLSAGYTRRPAASDALLHGGGVPSGHWAASVLLIAQNVSAAAKIPRWDRQRGWLMWMKVRVLRHVGQRANSALCGHEKTQRLSRQCSSVRWTFLPAIGRLSPGTRAAS